MALVGGTAGAQCLGLGATGGKGLDSCCGTCFVSGWWMGPRPAVVSASEGEDTGCWCLPNAMSTLGQGQEGTGACAVLSLLGTLSC